ncbi:MAG TPA: TadE family protein [Terracidiphilus sp.]|jgi:Flp pilus assembly protein TadG|nr:TadE family protein [Terracidiphilus sp.]
MLRNMQGPLGRFKARARRVTEKLGDTSGNASIELALAFSFLLTPLMLGTAEIAFVVYDSIEVSNAASAGAMYGMISSTLASNPSGIQAAAQAEASDFGSNLSVTSSEYYACSSSIGGTQYTTQAAAAVVCPANASNHYLQFVQVNSTATVTPPVRIPGLPATWTLHGTSVMEVQE